MSERIARWVLSRLPRDPAILELGVGTGRIAIPFIEAGVRYTGFDISEQMLSRLAEKLNGDLRRSRVLIHNINEPFRLPDRSQDAVVAVHILHLVDAVRALTHARPVLKPGGALVWGYDTGFDHNPHKRLRDRFHAEAEAMGCARRDYHAPISERRFVIDWHVLGGT